MTVRRYTEAQFRAAVADPEVRTLADLCRALGLVPRGANYETLRAYATELGIELHHLGVPRSRPRAPRPRRSYTDEDLLDALEHCRNYPELCRALGLRPVSGTYRRLRRHAAELGATVPDGWSRPGRRGPDGDERIRGQARPERPRPPRPTVEYDEADLRAAVSQARCLAEAIRLLGDVPTAVTYRRLKRGIARHGIDTTHFSTAAQQGGRAREPLDRLLTTGRRTNSGTLRRRLIREGRKEHVCEECGARRWRGQPMPLELDHVNGDRSDNRLENLRLLCPNCHALTPTYRGRNIGRTNDLRRA